MNAPLNSEMEPARGAPGAAALGATDLGEIVGMTGSGASARLFRNSEAATNETLRLTIGRLVGVTVGTSFIVGVVARMSVSPPPADRADFSSLVAEIDFMGEIRNYDTPEASFSRGVTNYPTISNTVQRLKPGDVATIHRIDAAEVIEVGRLRLDPNVHAYIDFEEMLRKHFAIVGTTGVGKSTAVALILQEILARKADLRIFLFDPHNEYASCFGEQANVVNPKNLMLPFWLFNFEEIVDVFFRGRPGVEEETELLQELIPLAKAKFAAGQRGDRILLRKGHGGTGYTADTPMPYRISDLVALIDERIGKLENRSVAGKYLRLINRIETLGNDSRYTFMFSNVFVEDLMVQTLGELFRMPVKGKPITVLSLAGFPSEVLDSLVSVICRMGFEFGVWSDGAAPLLFACEEAHRYAPADKKLGFGPTRKALSRIAKEGRKYGVFLGCITQRPADLDPTILSQCSTIFAMRLANENDQAIVKSAVPDSGASLVGFLASLGNRECIAFGEGVPLPTRFRFKDLPAARIPRSQASHFARLEQNGPVDVDFVSSVVDRWREATITNQRPRMNVMGLDPDGIPVDYDDGLGAPLIPRKTSA